MDERKPKHSQVRMKQLTQDELLELTMKRINELQARVDKLEEGLSAVAVTNLETARWVQELEDKLSGKKAEDDHNERAEQEDMRTRDEMEKW